MQSALNKLREGQLSFASFAIETRADWERLAAKLLTRWKAPSAVDSEDLVQELLLEAWVSVGKYDPERGPLKAFVVWRAMNAAKRWLNVQRGVSSHNGDKAKSRFARPAGDMFGEDYLIPTVEASQERIIQYLQRLQAAARMLYTEQNRVQPSSTVDFGDLEDVLELLVACGETPWSRVGKFLQQTAIQLEE
jgi:RNA polymerase sigma factor (sigma-70 family)